MKKRKKHWEKGVHFLGKTGQFSKRVKWGGMGREGGIAENVGRENIGERKPNTPSERRGGNPIFFQNEWREAQRGGRKNQTLGTRGKPRKKLTCGREYQMLTGHNAHSEGHRKGRGR